MELLPLQQKIQNTISAGESHFREFKSALRGAPGQKSPRPVKEICDDIAEALVAFSNADGGELLVGVEDNGDVSGVPHSDTDIQLILSDWKSRVQMNPNDSRTHLPIQMAQLVLLAQGKVLFFSVTKGTRQIFQLTSGRCVRRRDKATEPANVNQMWFEAQEAESRAYDQQFVDGTAIGDLDVSRVAAVAAQYLAGMTPEFYIQQVGLGEFGMGGLRLRKAALLLFAKDVIRWHPRSQIRVLKISGTELKSGDQYNVTSDEPRTGNIFELLTTSWELLRPFLTTKTQFGSDARFDQQYLFPEQACREALINAIAHRAYNIMNPIEVFIFDDRIEIRSPGALLSTITVQGLEQLQGVHESRNPLIARVLRESKFMRELGEGMKRIFESMEQRDIEKPRLYSNTNSFSITLQNRTIYTQQQELWLSVFKDYQLTPLQKRIVVAGMGEHLLSRSDIESAMRNDDRDTYDKTVTRLRNLGALIEVRSNPSAARYAKNHGISKDKVPRFKVIVPGSQEAPATKPPATQPENTENRAIQKPQTSSAPERRVFFQFDARKGVIDSNELLATFQRYGVVDRLDLPTFYYDGKQRGFGFVWYATRESAQLAVSQLNNSTVSGQKIRVEAYDTGR